MKFKHIVLLASLLSIISIESFAQRIKTINPSGEIVTTERKTPDFTGIAVQSGIEVEVAQGNAAGVVIKTDKNAIDHIHTEVRDGVLYICHAPKTAFNRINAVVYVTMPNLNNLVASSGSDIKLDVKGKRLNLSISSAARVSGNINYPEVNVAASSGAEIVLCGNSQVLSIAASSGSYIDTQKLIVPVVNVSATTGSTVRIYVSEKISASASSGSDIHYSGSPEKETCNSSSGATIKRST